MKKILFIASQPFFQWRGSPIRLGFDVMALAQLGYEVDFLTLPVGEERQIPGVRIIRVANIFGIKNYPIGPSFIKALFDIVIFFRALSLIRKNDYAVIHCVEDASAFGVFLAWKAGAKLIFEKHSDPWSYKKGMTRNLIMWLYSRVERFAVKHSDAVIATGPGLQDQVVKMGYQRNVHLISDIPSSLVDADQQRVVEIRSRYNLSEGRIMAAYVGSFAVYQGIELLFKSIPLAVRKNRDIRFLIIGGTPEEIEQRRTQMKEAGVTGNIEFAGKIPPDRLADYLSAADILLSPRLAGINTPLKVLDYLKAGRAIVATDTESNTLLLNSDTAYLVKPEPEQFADGIVKVAEDRKLRESIALNGMQLIREKYNFGKFKGGLEQCYKGLV